MNTFDCGKAPDMVWYRVRPDQYIGLAGYVWRPSDVPWWCWSHGWAAGIAYSLAEAKAACVEEWRRGQATP